MNRQPKRFVGERSGRVLVIAPPVPNVLRKTRPAPPAPQAVPVQPQQQMMSGPPDRTLSQFPLDMRILGRLSEYVVNNVVAFARWYPKPRDCIKAHSRGLVRWGVPFKEGNAETRKREAACKACPSCRNKAGVKPVNGEPQFCGYNGGCGCGHYVLARLTWKRRLEAWHCPAGRF